MTAISASMVKELREITGQAMMDCKKALTETDGDLEKAIDLLRKKGKAVLDKRGGRETKEGRVVGKVSADGKVAVLTSLCSETDFTAKNEAFQAAAENLAASLLQAESVPDSADGIMELATPQGNKMADIVNDLISQTGEKITIGEFARFDLDGPGLLYCYVHFNGKIATMIQINTDQAVTAAEVKTLASDLAMHITAINPTAACREEIDPQVVAREKDVAASQISGKPENMIEQIVNGKLNKWYKQVVLVEQPFVKDDSKTVQQVIDEVGKAVGSTLKAKRFARIQIG